MRRRTATWLSGLGAMVLIGIPVLALAESWDKNFPSSGRFQTLATFHNQAVLDKNTGLVWEQAPDFATRRAWILARHHCVNREVGGTVGWRLPSVIELKSVLDPSLPPPFVPTRVFTVPASLPSGGELGYWTATSIRELQAWWVDNLGNARNPLDKSDELFVWCVRGPMQESEY